MPDDDRLGGRRATNRTTSRTPFIWVEDDDTGHRYDVPETALRAGMTPVEVVEPNLTGRARRPKYRTDLAGADATRSGRPEQTVTGATGEPTPPADTTTKTSASKGGAK